MREMTTTTVISNRKLNDIKNHNYNDNNDEHGNNDLSLSLALYGGLPITIMMILII